MRQTTAPSPIDISRQHTAGDRRAADIARRIADGDTRGVTDGIEATRIRRLARTLAGPLRGGAAGTTRTA